jgi:hypothetical protein
MLRVLQQLPLIPNEFHVLSATPRDTECDMKQPADRDIAETIAIALCPLRRFKTQAQAQAGAETAIEMLRMEASQPFPDAASIRKIAKNLHSALESFWFSDGQQIPLEDCDRHVMTMREFLCALDWFEGLDGPSSKVDIPKHFAASHANCLVNEFSQKPPNSGNQVREIAGLLYEAVTGEEGAELKRQVATVHRSWHSWRHARGR